MSSTLVLHHPSLSIPHPPPKPTPSPIPVLLRCSDSDRAKLRASSARCAGVYLSCDRRPTMCSCLRRTTRQQSPALWVRASILCTRRAHGSTQTLRGRVQDTFWSLIKAWSPNRCVTNTPFGFYVKALTHMTSIRRARI